MRSPWVSVCVCVCIGMCRLFCIAMPTRHGAGTSCSTDIAVDFDSKIRLISNLHISVVTSARARFRHRTPATNINSLPFCQRIETHSHADSHTHTHRQAADATLHAKFRLHIRDNSTVLFCLSSCLSLSFSLI